MSVLLKSIFRYPLKGLTGEALDSAELAPGSGIPNDRRYALAPGSTAIDGAQAPWMPKSSFIVLLNNERIAQLETSFDEENGTLTVFRGGKQVARGMLAQKIGRTLLEDFFTAFLGDGARGRVKIVEAEAGTSLSDQPDPVISILNQASIDDLARVVGRPVDPRRFRGNLLIEGLRPWEEFDLCGKKIEIGGTVLEVTERIDRCGATNVNPDTAERDLNIPKDLQRGYGHIDCGVFAKVVTGGTVSAGDNINIL